ncbi:hypothetical protein KRZ98_05290 [Sphingobium sp. AS12]|uniref:hypothetical protein n=1 Tax=Sphingobium sp. AS12 TaxID=2849495 RepID=UPI001C31910A|nr:hypothetical protein [Sphingobium sp. AS12]MBV2147700.1 hypothetical protein [Sphingobium sp. AS12]
MKTMIAAAAVISMTVAIAPASAETFRMECAAGRPLLSANNPLGANEGSDAIRVTGQIDTSRGGFIIQTVTGTNIVRTGWSPFTSFDHLGPASKIDWRGADGQPRYYAMQLRTNGGAFWLAGYTERSGRRAMEFYQGSCRIL